MLCDARRYALMQGAYLTSKKEVEGPLPKMVFMYAEIKSFRTPYDIVQSDDVNPVAAELPPILLFPTLFLDPPRNLTNSIDTINKILYHDAPRSPEKESFGEPLTEKATSPLTPSSHIFPKIC